MTVRDLPYRLGNYTGGSPPTHASFYFTGHLTQEDAQ